MPNMRAAASMGDVVTSWPWRRPWPSDGGGVPSSETSSQSMAGTMTAGQTLLLSRLAALQAAVGGPNKWTFLSPLREEKKPSGTLTIEGDNVLIHTTSEAAIPKRF